MAKRSVAKKTSEVEVVEHMDNAAIHTAHTQRGSKGDPFAMTEAEFKRELKGSLLVLATSSPDKREIYRDFFINHDKVNDPSNRAENHKAGLDLFFADSGALGIAPRKTPEKTGLYAGNLDEKVKQQMATLSDREVQENIRLKLKAAGGNAFDPEKINIMGMTEDSGMELIFKDDKTRRAFIDKIVDKIKPKLREQDYWLVDKEKLYKTGFPGPNFKPLQERLQGGFDELMRDIYDVADTMKLDELRFTQTVNVSFVSPHTGKYFSPPPLKASGRLLTRDEYAERLMDTPRGKAVSINFVQVFDGQEKGEALPVDVAVERGLHQLSSKNMPMEYPRRDLTEYLQGLIGKRRSNSDERKREVNVAFLNADAIDGKPYEVEKHTRPINDLKDIRVPTRSLLRRNPHMRTLGDADVVVLQPVDEDHPDGHLYPSRNLGLLQKLIIDTETEPEAMRVPIIVDNRSGRFSQSLEILSNATMTGRFAALQEPYLLANTNEELNTHLMHVKDIKQRAPKILSPSLGDHESQKHPELEKVPSDGVFTVFVGGGHANNSREDLKDAEDFGYHCAKQGWRIITGGGSVEGSMGATHTGFVKYHLEQLDTKKGKKYDEIKKELAAFKTADGSYDAEEVILQKPHIVEKMAEQGMLPRDMFYAYSMKPLLEMESPSGAHPPGITYFDAGNRVRRLAALLASGTKVFLRGGVGTDEEFEETVKQHLEARIRDRVGVANDIAFTDGTPDGKGTMIIYNKEHHLDKLLEHYRILGEDPIAREKRRTYNIKVVDNQEKLQSVANKRADEWGEMVKDQRMSRGGKALSA